ncbi:MAG: PKD domain-containing protein, partial [Candidatus Thermoplasmatota archaeon]|nr:PKD domain-containing protein [Candidatus Thermoplasmatota archaeon]
MKKKDTPQALHKIDEFKSRINNLKEKGFNPSQKISDDISKLENELKKNLSFIYRLNTKQKIALAILFCVVTFSMLLLFVYPGLNNPPLTPNIFSNSIISGINNNPYTYSTSTIDPANNKIRYGWDWNGDGIIDEWSKLLNSGSTDTRSHTWASAGTYNIKVKAQDEHGAESSGSTPKTITIYYDNPPNKPNTPSGNTSGTIGISYTYSTNTIDTEGDQLTYIWDWNGDGTNIEMSKPQNSNRTYTHSHIWTSAGTYNIKVKALDEHGAESSWSTPKTVTISGSSNNPPLAPNPPSGNTSGTIGISYIYSTNTIDPEGDQLTYIWDWNGDGTNIE